MMTLFVVSSFAQQQDVRSLLENEQTREEIFNAIANDPEMMREFRQVMAQGDQMMMQDRRRDREPGRAEAGEQRMMDREQMRTMMHDNPEMMDRMLENMMQMAEEDPRMQQRMAEHMAEHPEVMESLMEHMRENGMMDEEGNMRRSPAPGR